MTAKVTKLDRNRSKQIDILHKLLTRIDIEKDAKGQITNGLVYFKHIMNRYFGDLRSYNIAYKELGTNVNKTTNTSFGSEYFLSTDASRGDNITYVHHINRSFYDAGISPLIFSDSIAIILTPGSYLDPANKTWSFEFPRTFWLSIGSFSRCI